MGKRAFGKGPGRTDQNGSGLGCRSRAGCLTGRMAALEPLQLLGGFALRILNLLNLTDVT